MSEPDDECRAACEMMCPPNTIPNGRDAGLAGDGRPLCCRAAMGDEPGDDPGTHRRWAVMLLHPSADRKMGSNDVQTGAQREAVMLAVAVM